MLGKILSTIELKRGSKNYLWKCLVWIKDKIWVIAKKSYTESVFFISWLSAEDFKNRPVDKFYKISFCITCMNRAGHIKKTLLKNIRNNIDYPSVEFVLLDYNSKDDLESWVKDNLKDYIKSGVLKYFQTKEPKYFHMSKAKNMSHRFATGNIVCNLDADNFTGKNFAYFINYVLNKKPKSVGSCRGHAYSEKFFDDLGISGRIFLFKKYFDLIGGYDESFVGWAAEDSDFVAKAKKLGLHEYVIPLCYLRTVKHSHKIRLENYEPDVVKRSPLLGWK
jgi:hypothetical protein